MNSRDRRLCIHFLSTVTGRSNGDAKRFLANLDAVNEAFVLERVKEWKSLGCPVRGIDGNWQHALEADLFAAQPASLAPLPAQVSVETVVTKPPVELSPARPKQKKVMYSILLPPSDLEALRALSDETGEAVAYHVRTAIKRYLKASAKEGV